MTGSGAKQTLVNDLGTQSGDQCQTPSIVGAKPRKRASACPICGSRGFAGFWACWDASMLNVGKSGALEAVDLVPQHAVAW